jgi:hypothetical protein
MNHCSKCGKPLAALVTRDDGTKQGTHLHLLFAGMCVAHRHECARCGEVVIVHEVCGYKIGRKLEHGWSHAMASDYAH